MHGHSAPEGQPPPLPVPRLDEAIRAGDAPGRAHARLAPHVVAYVGAMSLLVLVWLLAGLSGGSWYPWPVWPALGWGIGLACKLADVRAVRCAAH